MRRSRLAWLLVFPASAAACQLVDPSSDLDLAGSAVDASPAEGGTDATASEASVALEAGSAADVAVDTSFCSTVDAALCDDFDRAVVIPLDDPRWSAVVCPADSGASLTVNQTLNVAFPTRANLDPLTCYLASNNLGNGGHVHITLHLLGEPFDGGTAMMTILDYSLFPAPNDAGISQVLYQLLVNGTGSSAQLSELVARNDVFTPTEIANWFSQPYNWLISSATGCAITLDLYPYTPDASTATAQCGTDPAHKLQSSQGSAPTPVPNDASTSQIQVGYQVFATGYPLAGTMSYDDLVVTELP